MPAIIELQNWDWYISTIFIGLLLSCNSIDKQSQTTFTSTSGLSPASILLNKLRYQKRESDTLFSRSTNKLIVFAKITGKEKPVEIKNGDFPENVEVSYNLLKDKSGNTVLIKEFPFSESGDWDISYTHYFDENGNTYAFQRKTKFFDSTCTEDVAVETIVQFYSNNFQLLDKSYKLLDDKNRKLEKDKCQPEYDLDYNIYSTRDKLLELIKIDNGR